MLNEYTSGFECLEMDGIDCGRCVGGEINLSYGCALGSVIGFSLRNREGAMGIVGYIAPKSLPSFSKSTSKALCRCASALAASMNPKRAKKA